VLRATSHLYEADIYLRFKNTNDKM